MLDVQRARTDNITDEDRERFEEDIKVRRCSNAARASGEVRPSDLNAALEINSVLGEQVEGLQEEREKLLRRIGELEITVSQLNDRALHNVLELKTAKEENDVLRCNLEESVQEAQALRINLDTKTRDLKLMKIHAKNINNESDFHRRSMADTDWLLQKKSEENTRLKVEVNNRRRISSYEQEESQHLANDLQKAENKIHILTKRLQEKQTSLEALQEDSILQADKLRLLKSALESKIIELSDTKQEVEFLRRAKGKVDSSSRDIFQLHKIDRNSRSEDDMSSRNLSVNPIRRSDPQQPQQSLFVMLQNLSRASDMFASNTLDDVKEETENDTDQQNIDILHVYAHLTAAAVKAKYPGVDFPNANLVDMGQDLPFWELHPYYTQIFEGLKKQTRKPSPTNRKTGGWFRWMKKGE